MALIVRETLMQEILGRCDTLKTAGILGAEHVLKHHALELIEAAPTVDAEPVVHARWLCDPDGEKIYCSECCHAGIEIGTEDYPRYEESEYCPNCGAKMDADAMERAEESNA